MGHQFIKNLSDPNGLRHETTNAAKFYEFGPFRLDVQDRLLFRGQQLVSLPLKIFETLLVLVEHHGQIIGKSEIVKQLWPNTHVGGHSLVQNIFTLRKVLGGEHSEFIETIPKRGYRFLAPVAACDNEQPRVDWRASGRVGPLDTAKDALAIRLIAVLPFKSVDEDKEGNYFGVGLADTLITRLSALNGLIVLPTSTVIHYASSSQDAMRIGQELGVDSVLDGRIQKSNDKIRVTAQLINTHNGAPLWADKFDGLLANIFSLQDAISENVVQALTLKLSAAEQARLMGRDTRNTAAYQTYLKGRFHWNRRTPEGLQKAIQCFEQAIEQDPSYALAWAGLADCHILLNFYGSISPKESYSRALTAATTALKINANLVEAVTSRAFISAFFEWNWAEAEREFQRALALNPNYATAHHWYAEYLTVMNRPEEAITSIIRAQEMEPLSLVINSTVGLVLAYARRYDLAIGQLQQTIEMDPDFFVLYRNLGLAYGQKGMHREAIAALQKGLHLCPGDQIIEALLAYTYAIDGKRIESKRALNRLLAESLKEYVSPYQIAIAHTGRGEHDLAFQCLERAFEERSNWLIYLNVDPTLDNLRADARFADLLRRMKLGEA